VGTVDGSAAAIEAGAIQVGTAAEMTGTSTVLLMLDNGTTMEPAFIAMPHALPGLYLLLGAMVASGASLRWYRDQFGLTEVSAGGQLGIDPFDLLTQQAVQSRAGSDGALYRRRQPQRALEPDQGGRARPSGGAAGNIGRRALWRCDPGLPGPGAVPRRAARTLRHDQDQDALRAEPGQPCPVHRIVRHLSQHLRASTRRL